jgi:hypothetical protein
MPGARRAHLDLVTENRLGPLTKSLQLGRGPGTTSTGGQLGAEHEGHRDQPPLVTERADFLGRPANVPGGAKKLRMGVAHVYSLNPALFDGPYDAVSNDPVLDLGREVLAHRPRGRPRIRGDRHGGKATARIPRTDLQNACPSSGDGPDPPRHPQKTSVTRPAIRSPTQPSRRVGPSDKGRLLADHCSSRRSLGDDVGRTLSDDVGRVTAVRIRRPSRTG